MEALTPVKLFWSGGWDSTFRLLQLVLTEKKVVQPYYLIDPKRQSLRNEIKARREIQNWLFLDFPFTRELIQPTFFYEIGDIDRDKDLAEAYSVYREFRPKKPLDFQYLWLSQFCKQFDLDNMELCEENFGINELPFGRHVFGSFLVPIEETREQRIADQYQGTVIDTLFKWFRFPIRGYTRQEMETEAKAGGWDDYLYMTWFCQSPVRGRYPCATCDPCRLTIKQGFKQRIPWQRRLYANVGLERIRRWGAGFARTLDPNFHNWRK